MSAARRGRGPELVLVALALVLFALGGDWLGRAPAFQASLRERGVLRVVTWNVGQELAAGARGLAREQEAHVAERLRVLGADLVVLQELVDERQAERLADALGRGWDAAVASVGAGRYVALLADADALERGRLRGVGGRAVLATVTLDRRDTPPLTLAVAGVHAAAFSSAERNDLLGRVRGQLDAAAGAHPRLLAGDFNLDLDPGQSRDLFSDDAYLDVQTYNALLAATEARGALVDAGVDAGPTAAPDRRLDYVLVDADVLEVVQAGPWHDQRAPGMDHDPLVVDLRVRDR